jgi:hypothetical protein
MLRGLKSALLSASLILGLLVAPQPALADVRTQTASADEAAKLFNPTRVVHIEIIRSLGGPSLTKPYLNSDEYRKANVKIRLAGSNKYHVIRNVGVRQKGSYTRRFEKLSMKIKFDAFVEGQTFMGLERLTLNAMMQDFSMLHEATAYKLFRSAGIPAPRTGYARVKLDGAYLGLYVNVESIDKTMLKRWFNNTSHLYSGPIRCNMVPSSNCYEANIGDVMDRNDISNVLNLHMLEGEQWWDEFRKHVDLENVLRYMAIDIFLSNYDGFTGYNQNNHYVHFQDDGKMTLIPWGSDQTFPKEPKKQLNWDATNPATSSKATSQNSFFLHCIAYKPCHDELLRQGAYVSKLVERIKLLNFKNTIAEKVLTANNLKNDVSRTSIEANTIRINWIDDFLKLRQNALNDFLNRRAPVKLDIETPAVVKTNERITPTIQEIWEPEVEATYQWFIGKTPIKDATEPTLKTNKNLTGKKVKLRITLTKPNQPETVQYSKTIKVL